MKGCKCSWHLTNIGYKDFLSYSSTRLTFCFHPTKEDIIWNLLNLGSNIKEIILWVSLFSYFVRNKREESNTSQTSLLMLKATKTNSSTIIESSSIKVSNEGTIWFSSLSLKFMEIVKCNASLSNQCPCDSLRTHAGTIGKRQSTIIWQICQGKSGGTRQVTFTIMCLL